MNGDRRQRREWPDFQPETAPGREAAVLTSVAIGMLMLAVQLWLLTVALDRYLAGDGSTAWSLAVVSAAIFLGGLLAVWLLRRQPPFRG